MTKHYPDRFVPIGFQHPRGMVFPFVLKNFQQLIDEIIGWGGD